MFVFVLKSITSTSLSRKSATTKFVALMTVFSFMAQSSSPKKLLYPSQAISTDSNSSKPQISVIPLRASGQFVRCSWLSMENDRSMQKLFSRSTFLSCGRLAKAKPFKAVSRWFAVDSRKKTIKFEKIKAALYLFQFVSD